MIVKDRLLFLGQSWSWKYAYIFSVVNKNDGVFLTVVVEFSITEADGRE